MKRDVKLYYQVTLQSEALERIKKVSLDKFKKKFVNYYLTLKHLDDDELKGDLLAKWRLSAFAKKLYKTLHKTGDHAQESLEMLFKLRNKSLYYKYAMGFFISLIPDTELDRYVSMKLNMIAPKVKGIKFLYGKQGGDLLYKQLRSLLAVIDNRSYDLRITTTADHFNYVKRLD